MSLQRAAKKIIRPALQVLRGSRLYQGPAPSGGPEVTLKIGQGKTNPAWGRTQRGRQITIEKKPLIRPGDKVFAMGSCFAVEIRDALRQKGFEVLPRYFDLSFDASRQSAGKLPVRDNINHYDTFTIRQEFEMAFGGHGARAEDFWEVTSMTVKSSVDLDTPKIFQDPHRKRIFAGTPGDLLDLSSKLDHCIREGIKNADVYIITLGLIEVWKNKRTGRYLCMAPGRGQDYAEFILSDFQSNLDNMRRVCSLIESNAPGRPVIVTVSPVPLARTYTGRDIIVANAESKALLRTVAGQIEREFSNVTYWPSYEIAQREDIYEDDGRHVRRESVDKIVTAFMQAHGQK